jgi:arginase
MEYRFELSFAALATLAACGGPPVAESPMPSPAVGDPIAIPIAIIDAPSNLGLRPPSPGVEPGARKLAAALRATGLVARLGARDAGAIAAPPYSPDPDPAVGFRNGTALGAYSEALADGIAPLLAGGDFVLVLGGDCSVLLGAGIALARRGRYGLAFVDGHDDYSYIRDRARYHGRLTAAGLDLALATGNGPDALSNRRGLGPYIRPGDVVQLGLSRTEDDGVDYATETFEASGIHAIRVEEITRVGAPAAAADARSRLEAMPTAGFWIHVDADVLDQTVMPAVDSPNPRGLTVAELEAILATLLASPRAVGLEITIYDPDLDPDGRHGRVLAAMLVRAFAASGRFPTPR